MWRKHVYWPFNSTNLAAWAVQPGMANSRWRWRAAAAERAGSRTSYCQRDALRCWRQLTTSDRKPGWRQPAASANSLATAFLTATWLVAAACYSDSERGCRRSSAVATSNAAASPAPPSRRPHGMEAFNSDGGSLLCGEAELVMYVASCNIYGVACK